MDRFLIDERLTSDLVAVAKARGYDAAYVPHIGKSGWQDWNLVSFAVDNDYVIVTVNRRDFLKQHAKFDIHPGLVILIPEPRKDTRLDQVRLFEKALEALGAMNENLTNKLLEVLADGSVHIRGWDVDEHDFGHINNPKWR